MNAACNWLGTLTRENQEPAKSDLNQPQGSWKNWSSMPDCKCSWPWEWVLDLRKTCDSQNFLGILEVDLYMLGQTLSLQITLVQDKILPLGNQNWQGEGERHRQNQVLPFTVLWLCSGDVCWETTRSHLCRSCTCMSPKSSLSVVFCLRKCCPGHSMTKFAFWLCSSYPHYSEEHILQDLGRSPVCKGTA